MKFELHPEETTIYDDDGKAIVKKPTERVANAYFGSSPFDLGLLPPAVRWISNDGRGLIIERPPQIVETDTYKIPLPWTIYALRVEEELKITTAKLFVRPFSLSSHDDELYSFPFPGISDEDDFFLGMQFSPMGEIGQQIQPFIDNFWTQASTSSLRGRMFKKNMPDAWHEQYTQGIDKFLVFLQAQDLQDVTFTDFPVSSQPTLNQLMSFLQGEAKQGLEPTTAMEYLTELVKRA